MRLFEILMLLVFPLSTLARDERGIGVRKTGRAGDALRGNYHAMIVGINAYEEWRSLKTAVKDAQFLKEILIRLYGFAEKSVIPRTDRKKLV